MTHREKLIEVALPPEAIKRECARGKSIRNGHPSRLYSWWTTVPLAAHLVDNPLAHPDRFGPTHPSRRTATLHLAMTPVDLGIRTKGLHNTGITASADPHAFAR